MRKFIRRLFIAFLGFFVLLVAALTLWIARGPQATESRTTGGVLYTAQEVAASGSDLSVTTDVQVGTGPAEVPAQADISPSLSVDLSAGQVTAPPTVQPQDIAPTVPLTTDITLQNSTDVTLAPLTSSQGVPLEGQGGYAATTSGYEQRVVELEWPSEFQVGRSGAVRIKLKMLDSGALQPVAEVAGNEVVATPILITDRYDNYNAFVTATIAAPDFSIQSTSPAIQPMQRGGEVEWRWTLESAESHQSVISLGLAITWEAKTAGQPPGPTNVPIWGQTLQVDVNYVFGLITVPQASVAGTALAVLGFVAQVPLLGKILEIFLDLLFGGDRRRRRREKEEEERRKKQRRRK
jgi:hypothetical protein